MLNAAEKTVAEIRAAGGKADFISSDLRDASSAREVARRAVEIGGGHVDILINNAGIYPFGPTHETTEEMFEHVYSLNVKAPYFLVAELAPLMAKKGKGAIVNLSTMVADYGAPGMSLYGSSKAAINLLTKVWAAEYGPSGVRVNAVSPGPTRTEGTEAMGEGWRNWPPRRRLAVRLHQMRSRRLSVFGDGSCQFHSRRETRGRWGSQRHLKSPSHLWATGSSLCEVVPTERGQRFFLSQPGEQQAPLLRDEAKLAALPQGCKVHVSRHGNTPAACTQ